MYKSVLVAPDGFKGTLSAADVAAAIAAGLRESGVRAAECPVADGGEGTLEILLGALGGELVEASSTDALGRPVTACWGLSGDGATAVVEAARTSGLASIPPGERDAERASSRGVGELMLAAKGAGAARMIVCVGGTATTDGGRGALEAIAAGGGLGATEIEVVCDVLTPFESAAEVFAPQKGASADSVARLSERLRALAAEMPRDPRGVSMTGAGGGLAGGLWACCAARLLPGADYVLDALDFDRRLARVDAVVIGEGRLDDQSFAGKVGGAILARARERDVPVHAIVGGADIDRADGRWRGLESIRIAGSIPELVDAGRELGASA